MLHLHDANPPPHDFAGLRRGLALAWPRHTGQPVVRQQLGVAQTICHASLPPLCTYQVRDVDDAGFLLTRCVHSPRVIRVILANKIIVWFQTQKQTQSPPKWKIWALSADVGSRFFGRSLFLGTGGTENGQTQPCLGPVSYTHLTLPTKA